MEWADTVLMVLRYGTCSLMLIFPAIANRFMHGPYLRQKFVNQYLDMTLNDYELNPFNTSMLHHKYTGSFMLKGVRMPYISKSRLSLFYSWHIDGYGRIRRFSKAEKRLNEHIEKLLAQRL